MNAQDPNGGSFPCVVLDTVIFGSGGGSNLSEKDSIYLSLNKTPNETTIKYVRVNLHYIQRTDGSGNFTDTGDRHGNNFNGYDVSLEMIDYINDAPISSLYVFQLI